MEGSLVKQLSRPDQERDRKTLNPKSKEMTMNALVSTLYRDLTCAAAAVVISLVVAMSFVQSTNVARTTQTVASTAVTQSPQA
jgi:hypothetical protein